MLSIQSGTQSGLFVKLLIHLQSNFHIWYTLFFWYRHLMSCVKWAGGYSRSFRIGQGVRQGALLSPLLYTLFIDDLLDTLESEGLGLHINSIFCGSLHMLMICRWWQSARMSYSWCWMLQWGMRTIVTIRSILTSLELWFLVSLVCLVAGIVYLECGLLIPSQLLRLILGSTWGLSFLFPDPPFIIPFNVSLLLEVPSSPFSLLDRGLGVCTLPPRLDYLKPWYYLSWFLGWKWDFQRIQRSLCWKDVRWPFWELFWVFQWGLLLLLFTTLWELFLLSSYYLGRFYRCYSIFCLFQLWQHLGVFFSVVILMLVLVMLGKLLIY